MSCASVDGMGCASVDGMSCCFYYFLDLFF